MLLVVAFTVGLLTPLVTLVIGATYVQFDLALGTSTLGTDVLMILLILFLLGGAGATLSVDAWIVRRWPRSAIGRMLASVYRIIGLPGAAQLRVYLFLAFAAYGVVSLSALLFHVDDARWQSGDTVEMMLTNPYLSRLHGVFHSLEVATPGGFHAASTVAVVLQTVFQAGMILLIRWVWGYRFVVAYGLLFILLSLVALELSYLPFLELCLWALLFTRTQTEPVLLLRRAFRRIGVLPVSTASRHVAGLPAAGVRKPLLIAEVARVQPTRLTGTIAVAALLTYGLFVVTRPQVMTLMNEVSGFKVQGFLGPPSSMKTLKRIGLEQPNVFNISDLSMGNHWAVIWEREAGGRRRLVPYSAEGGERLGYLRSDIVYFGNSLRWHRMMIGVDPVSSSRPGGRPYELIRKILDYDYRRQGYNGPHTYTVELFEAPLTDLSLTPSERNRSRKVFQYSTVVTG